MASGYQPASFMLAWECGTAFCTVPVSAALGLVSNADFMLAAAPHGPQQCHCCEEKHWPASQLPAHTAPVTPPHTQPLTQQCGVPDLI